MKTCTSCHCDLPLSNFTKRKNFKSGLSYWCKECEKTYRVSYRLTDKGKVAIERGRLRYRQSGKAKLYLTGYLQTERGRALKSEIIKRYFQSDKGKANKARARHNRQMSEEGTPATLTAEEWNLIKKRYKDKCVYCGEKKPLTRDHLIPINKGGALTKENVVPACSSCNSRKNNRPVLLQLLA